MARQRRRRLVEHDRARVGRDRARNGDERALRRLELPHRRRRVDVDLPATEQLASELELPSPGDEAARRGRSRRRARCSRRRRGSRAGRDPGARRRGRARAPGRASARAGRGRDRDGSTPAVGRWTPARILISVLFPAPFSPSSASTSPPCTVRSTPRSACVAPKRHSSPSTARTPSSDVLAVAPTAPGVTGPTSRPRVSATRTGSRTSWRSRPPAATSRSSCPSAGRARCT